MRNLLNIIILFLTLTACREIKVDKTNLLASDYRLFQDTPAWDLAKAADDNNVRKIRKIIKKNPSLINYQEPIHGKTILMQACYHHDYDSFEQLLKLGANVNLYDKVHGASAIIIVCRYNAGAKYVQKLLEYGANPNDLEVGERRKGNSTRYTPLRGAAAKGDLESVKLLLQAGAEVNFYDEFGSCALGEAIIQNHYDVVLLLLLLQHGGMVLRTNRKIRYKRTHVSIGNNAYRYLSTWFKRTSRKDGSSKTLKRTRYRLFSATNRRLYSKKNYKTIPQLMARVH